MDEPVVTAGTPPARARTLAQQEGDFTEEGAPPPDKAVTGSAHKSAPAAASNELRHPGHHAAGAPEPARAHPAAPGTSGR
jgi:hypothetical protein